MRHFGEVFSRLLISYPKNIEQIARDLEFSRGHIYKLKKMETADSKLIDKVCRYFKVTPMVFFDNELLEYGIPASVSNEYNNLAIAGQATMNIGMINDIQNLKQILEEKERFIQFLLAERGCPDVS